MKKFTILMAMAAVALGAGAQTINVQSAQSDLKKGYLNRAKSEIDAASTNDATKSDPKTWYYRGSIYFAIGVDMNSKKPKFKNLAPDWAEQAYASALECKRLDEKKEWATHNNLIFDAVGREYYSRAIASYNAQDYAEAMKNADRAIEMFVNTEGSKANIDETRFIGGVSARAIKDFESMKKYFNQMINSRTTKQLVYRTMYDQYRREEDVAKATNVASRYVRNCKNDYNAHLLMAEDYLLNNNLEKGNEEINLVLSMTKDSVNLYPSILCLAAATLENIQDYAGAEAKYHESLELKPSQFEANFGMGKMIFNRGVDKLDAANAVPLDDETGLNEKLVGESNEYFAQSIQYFNAAINIIDNLPTEQREAKTSITNLYNTLNALKTIYARLERYDDLKAVNTRLEEVKSKL